MAPKPEYPEINEPGYGRREAGATEVGCRAQPRRTQKFVRVQIGVSCGRGILQLLQLGQQSYFSALQWTRLVAPGACGSSPPASALAGTDRPIEARRNRRNMAFPLRAPGGLHLGKPHRKLYVR